MTIDNMREYLDDKEFFYDGKRSVVFDTGDGRTYTLLGTEVPKKGPVVFRLKLAKEARKTRAVEKMNDGQLLGELVKRFIKYDNARDSYIGYLQNAMSKAGMDYESLPRHDKLHMDQDEKFCLCREIVRIVKKDPNYMWC